MLRLIEALGYRSLRDTRQSIERFQLLVGPNASGKSTFLDVARLFGDLLDHPQSVIEVVRRRSPNFQDLTWMKEGNRFDIALEAEIPEELRNGKSNPRTGGERSDHQLVRYELRLGFDDNSVLGVLGENLWLKTADPPPPPPVKAPQRQLFPEPHRPREGLVHPEKKRSPAGWRKVLSKSTSGNVYFTAETSGWNAPFRLGPERLGLANLPEDEDRFPVAVWFRRMLATGIQSLALSAEAIRRPSPPGSPIEFQPDGSNRPWAIHYMEEKNPPRFAEWLDHVRTALPDIALVRTVDRPEEHRYLVINYGTGLSAPSWTVSDGTLRLLALTLVAYLDVPNYIYLIEEPENGIHPQAVETIYQALSSTYDCQFLCATHSPVLLSLADPNAVLCFARTQEGETDIVRGTEHPNLREWKRGVDLGTMFATGILG